MKTKTELKLRIGRTFWGTWVVENCAGYVETVYETQNKVKAQGVLEYLTEKGEL